MVKLELFSFGGKQPASPLADARAAADWHARMVREAGVGAHERITTLLAGFNNEIDHPQLQTLEAILELDRLGRAAHEQLSAQYLAAKGGLEFQLRGQILPYGKQFISALQRFINFDPDGDDAPKLRPQLPLIIGKMMNYLIEHAIFQFYRHASLDEVMWGNVNQLFRYAEEHGIDAVPVMLYPEEPATTIHDLYLSLLMMSLLNSGNLMTRQLRAGYQLVMLLSNRMTLSKDLYGESSFMVNIHQAVAPARSRSVPQHLGVRVWSTVDMIDQLNVWIAVCDGGSNPPQLRQFFAVGGDVALLRFLAREWAVKPFRFDRAERVQVVHLQLEVGRTFAGVHKLVRDYEESLLQSGKPSDSPANVEEAAEIRIYGFVTSRRREKLPQQDVITRQALQVDTCLWEIDNRSETGFGVYAPSSQDEWLTLGTLLATREAGQLAWGLSIVRRMRRLDGGKTYLGLQLLTARPVAASIRPENGRHADPTLPQTMLWNQGEIALFVSTVLNGVKTNTLIIPLSSYAPGKHLQMFAKNKGFLIALGKVIDKGGDWCQAEIELIRSLS